MKNRMNTQKSYTVIKSFCLICSAIFLTGCPSTRTGNPEATVSNFSMKASTTTVIAQTFIDRIEELFISVAQAYIPSSITDGGANSVTLSEAWISVQEIEFKTEETSSGAEEAEIQLQGPYFVDLFASTPQVLGETSLQQQAYHRIKMQFHPVEEVVSGSPSGLQGNSIYIEGTVASNPFTYSTTEGTELEISGPTGVTPLSGSDLLGVIKIGELIQSIDLSAVISAGDRNINDGNKILATNPCPTIVAGADNIFVCFRSGIEQMSYFGRDDDGSGDIEADEDSSE